MINNLNLVLPEIFLSLMVMFNLIFGVYKKNSSNLVFNISLIILLVTIVLIFNLIPLNETLLFGNSYKIDILSSFMKILMLLFAFFIMLSSSKYLKYIKIF